MNTGCDAEYFCSLRGIHRNPGNCRGVAGAPKLEQGLWCASEHKYSLSDAPNESSVHFEALFSKQLSRDVDEVPLVGAGAMKSVD